MVWFWVVLWVLLVLGAGVVLTLIGRMLWGKAKLLLRELSDATEKLAPAADRLQEAAEQQAGPELAVFDSPTRLRQERFVSERRRERERAAGGRHAAPPAARPAGPPAGRST